MCVFVLVNWCSTLVYILGSYSDGTYRRSRITISFAVFVPTKEDCKSEEDVRLVGRGEGDRGVRPNFSERKISRSRNAVCELTLKKREKRNREKDGANKEEGKRLFGG